MEKIKKLLLENRAWAKGNRQMDPGYFESLAKGQNPDILWIGCADSRVPPGEIINANPGDLFVHRNIANIVYLNDKNFMSVLEYAIYYLKVNYIIICGHYNCGGVKAAFEGVQNFRISDWVSDISKIKVQKQVKNLDELIEANIVNQVEKLEKHLQSIHRDNIKVLGWAYDLKTGLIKSLS